MDQSIFKAYDIRGIYPAQINEQAVFAIAQAYAKHVAPKTVVLGRDVRLSGPSLFEHAMQGLLKHGVNVIDIGVVSTDMLYFAVNHLKADGGITISASHNPKEYNGMKLVRKQAIPISQDTGIVQIKELVKENYQYQSPNPGEFKTIDIKKAYLDKCLSFINISQIKRMRVVANAMFGPALQNILSMNLPLDFVLLNETPDGNFPKGQPDPMQEVNRRETAAAIKQHKADLGVAWDADADRFFLFDEQARFIPGYYLTAFLAGHFAQQTAKAKIIHDPRLTWAIIDQAKAHGGVPVLNKVGHSFIKERMRKEDAVFAGESSGHFYFKDFYYCDNGLIPFLLVLEILSKSQTKLSQIFDPYFAHYHISEELNQKLPSQEAVAGILRKLETEFADAALSKVDGLSIEYPDWRANIRSSNTEPLLRLNAEAKSQTLLEQKLAQLQSLMNT